MNHSPRTSTPLLLPALCVGIFLIAALGGVTYIKRDRIFESPRFTQLPLNPSATCRGQESLLFDECSSQRELFEDAKELAADQGKQLIVVYGAEICVWCHVFAAFVQGGSGRFEYQIRARQEVFVEQAPASQTPPEALERYIARNIVLFYMEGRHAGDGYAVLEEIGAEPHFDGILPFVFSLNDEDNYSTSMSTLVDREALYVRRSEPDKYYGFNREILLSELRRIAGDVF